MPTMNAYAQPDSILTSGQRLQQRMNDAAHKQAMAHPDASESPAKADDFVTRLSEYRGQKAAQQHQNATEGHLFHPQFTERESEKSDPTASLLGLRFDFSSFFNYYNLMRTSRYMAQATFSGMSDLLGSYLLERQGASPETIDAMKKGHHERHGSTRIDESGGFVKASKEDIGDSAFLKVEALVFTSLAAGRMWYETNRLLGNCRLSLAAELGRDPEDIGWQDIFRSENPLISTEADKLKCKFVTRTASGLGFIGGLGPGLFLDAINIGAERTIFYKKSAYDLLLEAVYDVQSSHMQGDAAKEILVGKFQRVLQSIQLDHHKVPLSEKEMHDLVPVLNILADDVIDKTMGVEDTIAIMGGGVIIPGNPERSMDNYYAMREHGVDFMVHMAQKIRHQHPGSDNVWDKVTTDHIRQEQMAGQNAHDVPDSILRERHRVNSSNLSALAL